MLRERDENGRFLPSGSSPGEPTTTDRTNSLGKLLGSIDDIFKGTSALGKAVKGIVSVIGGALTTGINLLGNIITSVVGFFSNLIGSVARLALMFGTLLASLTIGAVTAFVGGIIAATKASIAYATQVNQLRLSSNISLGQAGAASLRYGAFGIGPQQLSQMFGGQPSQLLGMKARMYGLGNPLTDPNFISQFAQKSQSFGPGMMGFYRRESMLKNLGMDNDQGRFLGSLSQKQISDQQSFAAGAAKSLGVGPETLRRMAEELPLAIAKIQIFIQLLTVKFAQQALPIIQVVLEKVIAFISKNGPKIAETIQNIFRWLYADAPVILVDAAITIIETLQSLAKGFFSVGHTVVAFLRTLESADSGLGGFIGSFLKMVDLVSVGFNGLITALAGLGFVLGNLFIGIYKFVNFLPNLFGNVVNTIVQKIGAPLLKKLGLGGLANTISSASQARADVSNTLQSMPFINWKTAASAIPKPLDLYGQFANLQQSGVVGKFADSADAALNRGEANADKNAGNALNFLNKKKGELGTKEERRAGFDGVIKELQKGNEINSRTEKNTRQTADNIGSFARDTVNRVLANIATDTFLANVGS